MTIEVAGRRLGAGAPCFVVAEIGQNHNGHVDVACALVEQAARAGADAVKLQTVDADELWGAQHPQFESCRQIQLASRDYEVVLRKASEHKLVAFSTPFDERSADFLDAIGVPLFKIGSGELTHHALLRHVARKGKPMLISTGMADLDQIQAAVRVVRETHNDQLVLMHCVSLYPAPVSKSNVRAVETLRHTYGTLVGFSDHSLGTAAALGAVVLGACVIEKHFTLSRALPDADHEMSMEPSEFRVMVDAIREVEAALGTGHRGLLPEEEPLVAVARRGIYARRALARGEVITAQALAVRRPLSEIAADQIFRVVGRRCASEIPEGTALRWQDLAD